MQWKRTWTSQTTSIPHSMLPTMDVRIRESVSLPALHARRACAWRRQQASWCCASARYPASCCACASPPSGEVGGPSPAGKVFALTCHCLRSPPEPAASNAGSNHAGTPGLQARMLVQPGSIASEHHRALRMATGGRADGCPGAPWSAFPPLGCWLAAPPLPHAVWAMPCGIHVWRCMHACVLHACRLR